MGLALGNRSDSGGGGVENRLLLEMHFFLRETRKCDAFVTSCRKLECAATACSYLRMFEEGGDASDVQAQAS